MFAVELVRCFGADVPSPISGFPAPFNTEPSNHILTPAAEALAKIKAPPGFNVTLLAAEPEVQNPIAMTIDERGRLWVAENYTYAESGVWFDLRLRDRILVFEDTKHNGQFDKRTVFWDGAQRLTSLEVGFGGVWVFARQNSCSFPIATATSFRTALLRSCWTAGTISRSSTTLPTDSNGARTAGCTAGTASWPIHWSANQARPPPRDKS